MDCLLDIGIVVFLFDVVDHTSKLFTNLFNFIGLFNVLC